jgi:hypothetical protein
MPGGRRAGAGRKAGDAWKGKVPRPPLAKALAQRVVREVLACDRNPVLRLVEIAYDPKVPVDTQVAAAAAACPYLFPRKSLDVTATVALDHPNASAIVDKLLRRFASLPQHDTIDMPAMPQAAAEIAA